MYIKILQDTLQIITLTFQSQGHQNTQESQPLHPKKT